MFLANNRLFSTKSEALSGKFISPKWEAKDTYLVVPGPIPYLFQVNATFAFGRSEESVEIRSS